MVDGAFGIRREGEGVAATGDVERETKGGLGVGDDELEGGYGLELGGNHALAFVKELVVQDVDAQRRVRVDGVSVLAGQSFKLGDGSFGGLRGMRRGPRKAGRGEKKGKAESSWSDAETEQAKGPPRS